MIERLETSFRQIRQFSSDASHELRTPLTVMKGETELALRRPRETDDYKIVLESNLEEIDRMTRIVDELLFLSRADMGEVKMEHVPVPLDALVEDLHRQASLLGQERDIQVVLRATVPAVVLGDELRLRELFLNLLDNAVKYSHPGGTSRYRSDDRSVSRPSVRDRSRNRDCARGSVSDLRPVLSHG